MKILIAATITAAATSADAQRSAIRIVGSSTVFPFATAVIEVGATTDYEAPVMSSMAREAALSCLCWRWLGSS